MKQLTLIFSLKNDMTLIVRCIELFYDNYLVYPDLLTRSFFFFCLCYNLFQVQTVLPQEHNIYIMLKITSAVYCIQINHTFWG